MKIFNGKGIRLTRAFLTAVFILLTITVIAGRFDATAAEPSKPEAPQPQSSDYIIGPEDILEISVWKNADLSKVVTVRPDGKISLPLLGDMKAAGLTPNKLRQNIIDRLKEYQQTAVASVIVQTVNSYRIYILGEVRTPGTYLLKSSTTVLQAISMAGGFTQYASKNKIVLVRHNGNTGSEEKIDIRFNDLVYDDEDKNLILQAGDTIFVP